MAIRLSTGLRQAVAGGMSLRNALSNSVLKVYSSTQPASADDAVTGTLLATFTPGGLAYTGETRATATITLSGSSGSIDTVKVGGGIPLIGAAVNFDTDLTTTAANLAAAINSYLSIPDFTATSSGATVTISAPIGLGADANGLTLAVGTTTLTATINGGSSSTFGGTGATAGVTAVNGIQWDAPTDGVLSLSSMLTAVAAAGGSALSFRIECDPDDDQGSSTTFRRLDGSIATSGGDLNALGGTTLVAGLTYTLSDLTITLPAG